MATPIVAEAVDMTLREVLHWLVDKAAPPGITEVIAHPAPAADVRAAIDKAFHYTPPEEQLSADEATKLNELLAKQQRIADAARAADAAAAEQAAGVDTLGL